MAWQTIIHASSSEEAQAAKPTIADIPAGSRVRIRVEFSWYMPIGKIGDLAGSELWVPKLLPYDLEVTDVYGDWHWFQIEGVSKGFGPAAVVIVVCALLVAFGLAWCITDFLMQAEITERAVVEAEREERRYEYVAWRTSPEGGSATTEQAWQEVQEGAPPEAQKAEATSMFSDLFPEASIAGIGLIVILALLFMSGRKE